MNQVVMVPPPSSRTAAQPLATKIAKEKTGLQGGLEIEHERHITRARPSDSMGGRASTLPPTKLRLSGEL